MPPLMPTVAALDSGLVIDHELVDDYVLVHVGGPLKFPDAVALTHLVKSLIEQAPTILILDLTQIGGLDATGVAVLVGVGHDLKDANTQVRVVVSDPRVGHRLPYTLGLRKMFTSLEEALLFEPE